MCTICYMSRQKSVCGKNPQRERERCLSIYGRCGFLLWQFHNKANVAQAKDPEMNDRHLWQVQKRHYDVYYATDLCVLISSWRICLLHAADYIDAAKASPKIRKNKAG